MPDPDAYQTNMQRALQLLAMNRPREAVPYFQNAIAIEPGSAHAFAQLARCWNEIPAERAKVIPTIDHAISLAPTVSSCFGLKALLLIYQTDYRDACEVARQGLALNPNCIPSLLSLANAETKLQQWTEVEAACLRILQINPTHVASLNLLAQALGFQRRWNESGEIAASVLAINPSDAVGHVNAGHAALAAGDHCKANEHFAASLRVDPNLDLARSGLLSSIRARSWLISINNRLAGSLKPRPATPRNIAFKILGRGVPIAAFCVGSIFLNRLHQGLGLIAMAWFFTGIILYYNLFRLAAWVANFVLVFDPIGRYALTHKEKTKACFYAACFVLIILALLAVHAWIAASALFVFFGFLALSILYPLLKDRWIRRLENESVSAS